MKYIEFGNILDVEEGLIIQGCNARGIMGGGLALQVKQKYPDCFEDYKSQLKRLYDTNQDPLGLVLLHKVKDKLYILNAITQRDFGHDKRYVDYRAVKSCFEAAAIISDFYQLPIHYPMLGAGLAGGDWSIISEIIDVALSDTERTLWHYES